MASIASTAVWVSASMALVPPRSGPTKLAAAAAPARRARFPTDRGPTFLDPVTSLTTPSARVCSLPPWPLGRPLRAWQREALEAVAGHGGGGVPPPATPPAGKATLRLRRA